MKTSKPDLLQFLYLRTTKLLIAENSLIVSDVCKVKIFDSFEAMKFSKNLRSNMVARLGGQNNFYQTQASELSDQTIIEIYKVATPDEILKVGENLAFWAEKLAILSTTFTLPRKDLLRRLGISTSITSEVNFAVTNSFKTIRSSSQNAPKTNGIKLNKQVCNRFSRCGFKELFQYLQGEDDLCKRINVSTDRLFESRCEPKLTAAVVKTAIALESLLIFSESESLARALSERMAFILSNLPETRQKISRVISKFYEVRSGIVHGGKKKVKSLSPALVECVDRLAILIYLLVANNKHIWPSIDSLRLWCEDQKWSSPATNINMPFPQIYLKNALALVNAEMK